MNTIINIEYIQPLILLIRGAWVLLDSDLAQLYGVTTKRLNEQVKRNPDRFPADFMFQVTETELSEPVANCDRFKNLKHSTSLPYAFTELGALTASTVLNSPIANQTIVHLMRAFEKLAKAEIRPPRPTNPAISLEDRLWHTLEKARTGSFQSEVYQDIRALLGLGPRPVQTKSQACSKVQITIDMDRFWKDLEVLSADAAWATLAFICRLGLENGEKVYQLFLAPQVAITALRKRFPERYRMVSKKAFQSVLREQSEWVSSDVQRFGKRAPNTRTWRFNGTPTAQPSLLKLCSSLRAQNPNES